MALGCGTTYHLLELSETQYKNHFDYIYLVCPKFPDNETYQNWSYVNDSDFLVIGCDHDDVDHYLKLITYVAQGTNSLIILDDCASSQAAKNRTNELVKLGFSARHYGLSTIVITQQLTSIAKPYRENISKLVTFHNPSGKDTDTLFNDCLSIATLKERKDIVKTLTSHDYARLEILLRCPCTHEVVIP